MSKPSHTPGPWQWDEPSNWYGLAALVYHEVNTATTRNFEPIGEVSLSDWPKAVGRANARLIAAAPDLLAACAAWVEWMDSDGDGTDKTLEDEDAMIDAMRAAVRKATGG